MGFAAAGLAVIVGGYELTKKNPYSAKDVKGSIGIASPLTPGTPPVMPDQTTANQAAQLQESKDAALRYGRASTVLTSGSGSGTSDKLGP